jgi:ABC-2 type transport system ATP-binding protein
MAGWLRPTRGTVAVGGQPLVGRLSHPTAFAPDGESLYPFFTVAEHVDYANRVWDDFRRDRADEALKFLSVPRERRVGVLSRGQRARVKLALMLARTCPLILLDEPLAGLDPLVRESLLKGLVSFVDLDVQTIVLSTHEVTEVEPVLDVAVLMENHRVAATAAVDQLEAEYGGIVPWMRAKLSRASQ